MHLEYHRALFFRVKQVAHLWSAVQLDAFRQRYRPHPCLLRQRNVYLLCHRELILYARNLLLSHESEYLLPHLQLFVDGLGHLSCHKDLVPSL